MQCSRGTCRCSAKTINPLPANISAAPFMSGPAGGECSWRAREGEAEWARSFSNRRKTAGFGFLGESDLAAEASGILMLASASEAGGVGPRHFCISYFILMKPSLVLEAPRHCNEYSHKRVGTTGLPHGHILRDLCAGGHSRFPHEVCSPVAPLLHDLQERLSRSSTLQARRVTTYTNPLPFP